MAGDHKETLAKVRKLFSDLFEESEQSIYIYLDDLNKVCNEKFARLLGYASAKEWAAVKENFPEVFVTPHDRKTLVSAYQDAMEKLVGATVTIRWKKKGGGQVPTTTILVPITFEGHRLALHFITPT